MMVYLISCPDQVKNKIFASFAPLWFKYFSIALFEGFNPLYPTNAIKVFVIGIDLNWPGKIEHF